MTRSAHALQVSGPRVCVRTVSSLRDSGSFSHLTQRWKRWANLFRAYGAALRLALKRCSSKRAESMA